MNYNDYILGMFGGALLICVIMLNFSREASCQITVDKGQITTVYIGRVSN